MNFNFDPQLIHIYGHLGIHSYGLFIAIGIIISMWAIKQNKRFAHLHLENVYLDIITMTIIIACIGGRALAILSEPHLYPDWYDWFALWKGGFSTLGSVLGIILIMPLYLKKIQISILPLFDLIAIYAPLMQAIGRLGCFTAGCCYGKATTNNAWSIIYTNPHTLAPYGIALYPTQIYSSLMLFGIFFLLFFVGQKYIKKEGHLFALYLILVSTERFIVDFWRDDRIMTTTYLSFHQIVALCIIITIVIFYYFLAKRIFKGLI